MTKHDINFRSDGEVSVEISGCDSAACLTIRSQRQCLQISLTEAQWDVLQSSFQTLPVADTPSRKTPTRKKATRKKATRKTTPRKKEAKKKK